jgi:hypothetical protein
MKKFLNTLVILSLFVSSLLIYPEVTEASEKVLNVKKYTQAKPKWCWVSASKSIVNYHKGVTASQCTIYKWVKIARKCSDRRGTLTNYKNVFKKAGFTNLGTQIKRPISFQDLRFQIDKSRPLLARITFKKSGSNHAAPIRGYSTQSSDLVHWIYISTTPSKTQYRVNTYQYLKNNSSWGWTVTRYGMY